MESPGVGTCLTGEELTLLADGLDDPDCPAAAHLASCATCSAQLRKLRQTVALAQPPEVRDPGEGFNRAVWRKIDRRRAQQRVGISMAATLSAAAIALVVLLPRDGAAPDETELVENLDLYQYVDLIENLDAVEALDALLEEGPIEG
ncbi:MAG: hypothetical protein MUE60_15355 [Candidatus Eisenbacteria bacterium]|jgi:hypothetical protein|nr:hypothetical protein [Candidatus Eisenbacteria bacterium]